MHTDLPTGADERPQEYRAETSFDELNLSPELRRAIAERGYAHPTPVQAKAYGPARAGQDLIVRSKTGTGKTAAFGMPLIDQIPVGARGVHGLVLGPTRELALQVAQELETLAKYRNIEIVCIYGGASMHQQEEALRRGAAIVVGTPGRVFDHIRRGNLKLEQCRHAVLDEADEMLNQGFYEEVTRILDYLPAQKQVMLFSATVPEDIERLIARYTNNPQTLLLSGDVFTVEHIQHIRYEISQAYPKPRNLLYVLEMEDPENAIIFCNTRDDTELVTAVLNRNGFDAELLNGDLPQKERERVMARVKSGELAFMVATDIAARGIDISHLGHVINYSLPEDPAVYLHRVGRTGRIGRKGTALNLTSGRELATLTTLERKYGVKFETKIMPTAEQATAMWTERHVKELKSAALGSIYEGFLSLAGEIKRRPDADELIAFMLRFFFTRKRMERAQHHETPRAAESEKPQKSSKRDREREPRKESSREPRKERSTRPRRDETSTTAPTAAAADASTPPAAPPAPAKRLSDREMFELMQSGQPLPAIEDPTSDSAATPPERPRRERPKREKRETIEAAAPGHVRLWVNLGKSDGLNAEALNVALSSLGVPTDKVAKADIRGTYSYLDVLEAEAAPFEALAGKLHGEKSLKVERARK